MNTLPSELNHPAIALEKSSDASVPASMETAPTPVPAVPSVPLLSTFGTGTQRQLELTVNAMARSVRKAIRRAERLESDGLFEEADKVWQQVNQRSAMLQDLSRTITTPIAVAVVPQPAPIPVPEIVEDLPSLEQEEASINTMLDDLAKYVALDETTVDSTIRKNRAITEQKARIREAYLHLAARRRPR